VTNESAGSTPGQTVRVSPSISWDAQFELKCYGVPDGFPLSVGADPWAEARGGVAVKVFGQNGQFVTQNEPPVELFQGHHSDSPYSTEPSTLPWTDGGLSTPGMHVYFSIPPGETRWVNFDTYVEVATDYNEFWNAAQAFCGLSTTLKFVVLDPE
jgi:predicted SnoaL-like aldol condensation-catalyzing enzyme